MDIGDTVVLSYEKNNERPGPIRPFKTVMDNLAGV